MNTTRKNGFTLIELIIVMVILGIMAAVAVPRYLDSISNAEESAEDAVINSIRAGLKQYANNKLYSEGRAIWPNNPFDALSEKPAGYDASDNGNESGVGQLDGIADSDGEWTFDLIVPELHINVLIILDTIGFMIKAFKPVIKLLLAH